jgi:hypothetical protein
VKGAHSYEQGGMCRACGSVNGCKVWWYRTPRSVCLFTPALREQEVREARLEIEAQGIMCRAAWLNEGWHREELEVRLRSIVDDVRSSDALVLATLTNGLLGSIEDGLLGMALAMEKRIIVNGPMRNALYHLPEIDKATTWAHVLELLRGRA